MVIFEFKDKYDINDLLEIMRILRAPGGCPWDIVQTHESIKSSLIEETYEAVEAINKQNADMLLEELGDVLLQVVFHARIEEEAGSFSFGDVCDGICKKLIIRHPHVFGDVEADTPDEVLTNWDAIKRKTKHQDTYKEAMQAVPREFPALMRSVKLQHKAAKAGIGATDLSDAIAKVKDAAALNEVTSASIGELLFAICGLADIAKIDAEDALSSANDRFLDEFPSDK